MPSPIEVQPFESVTVTVNTSSFDALPAGIVGFGLFEVKPSGPSHKYVEPADSFTISNIAASPSHTQTVSITGAAGNGFIVIVPSPGWEVQPLPSTYTTL